MDVYFLYFALLFCFKCWGLFLFSIYALFKQVQHVIYATGAQWNVQNNAIIYWVEWTIYCK